MLKMALPILIIILGFAVYANSMDGKFVWDDYFLVRDNAFIKSWADISKIFTRDMGAGSGTKFGCYRPFSTLTYLVNYSLCKLDVRCYHLTNIILHIFVALAVFWLTAILFNDRILSVFTAALFVVHPVHTEAVAYIFGRSDSLAALFMLGAFIFYVKHLSKGGFYFYISALLSYILALLSRENALILPMLILLYHYSFKKELRAGYFLPVTAIAAIYLLLRTAILGGIVPLWVHPNSFVERLPGFFAAVINYMRILILPLGLHIEYGANLFKISEINALSGIIMTLILLIHAFRKENRKSITSFSILWFFIALLPVSGIYPNAFYMTEHWLYFPSVGFFLILSMALNSIYRTKKFMITATAFIVILLLFYSYTTIRQNVYWRDPISLFNHALRYAPDSPRVNNNLGSAYYDIGEREKAAAFFKKAIELDSGFAEAYYNLGNISRDNGETKEAILLYKKAIEIMPDYAAAYNNIGIIYASIGLRGEAIASFKKALEINPYSPNPYCNLEIIDKEEAASFRLTNPE